jgi:hypothetical protein
MGLPGTRLAVPRRAVSRLTGCGLTGSGLTMSGLTGSGLAGSRLAGSGLELARLARIRPQRTGLALCWPARGRLAGSGLELARLVLPGHAGGAMGLPGTRLTVPRRALSRLAGIGVALSRLAGLGLALSRLARRGLALPRRAPPRLARRGLKLTRSVGPVGRRIFVTCWHADPARHTCSVLALRIGPDQHKAADRWSGRIG